MIPSEFEYHRPSDIQSVLQLLQSHGDEARVLAGGHSLVPAMKMRLTGLSHLIDLQDIGDLKGISIGSDDVTIGAMTTQHDVITDEALARTIPIIREAATQIADPQVRYVGTVGGNIANGDPANDMPGLMQCLGARFELIGPGGTRVVPAGAYYHSAYVTERADDEVLTQFGPKPRASRWRTVIGTERSLLRWPQSARSQIKKARLSSKCMPRRLFLVVPSTAPCRVRAEGENEDVKTTRQYDDQRQGRRSSR